MACQRLDNVFTLPRCQPAESTAECSNSTNCVDIQLQEAQDKEMLVVIDAGEVKEFIVQMMVLIF